MYVVLYKQNAAYELRICDWSSDVCSSDLFTKLSSFKAQTRQTALVGSFSSLGDLKAQLIRDLNSQVKALQVSRRKPRLSRLERAARMTELIVMQKQHDITPEEFRAFEQSLAGPQRRSEEHTSELQSLMRISYAVFCLKKKNRHTQ